jgi:O-antigen/teichoic acid export membrane protein
MSKSNTVKHELIANYAGRIWTVLANFLCVPLYVRWLGPESYGVVAFVTTIQSATMLFDFGFTTGISREVARRLALGSDAKSVRDFVRTLELAYWLIGLILCAGIAALAGPISTRWLTSRVIDPQLVRTSLFIGAVGILFTWPVTFYMGLMIGLRRQVSYNLVNTIGLTVRFSATALVCLLLPRNLIAFFSVQAITAGVAIFALFATSWHFVPIDGTRATFRWAEIAGAGTFLSGMTLANGAALLFTQMDKIILSKWLTLEQFGYYTLAWTLAGVFYLFYSPVSAAFLPRFSALIAVQNTSQVTRMFHTACQLVAIGAFPTAAVLALFPYEAVTIWAHDAELVRGTAPLLQILVPFAVIGCIGYVPSVFQWAHGWTRLTTTTYLCALAVVLPAMYFGYSRYGTMGAIVGWGIVRVGQSVAQIELMHARLLAAERWKWYRDSILRPASVTLGLCCCWRFFAGQTTHMGVFRLILIWSTCVIAAMFSSPLATRIPCRWLAPYSSAS